jgi:hypothetical protein
MNPSAKVHSLDALRELRTTLVKFREEVSNALTAVDIEARHAHEWLKHDQLKFWQSELRRSEDLVGECKTALHRCQLMKLPNGETPSCSDEKKQLAKAKARLEIAEDKIKLVKKWTMIVEQEMIEYRGPVQQLDLLVQSKLVSAVADLDSRIRSLEAYLETVAGGVDLGMAPAVATPSADETKPTKDTKPS